MELAQINFFFNSDLFSPKISSKGFITMFKIKRIHTHENTHTRISKELQTRKHKIN
jgi:hypothetical protein